MRAIRVRMNITLPRHREFYCVCLMSPLGCSQSRCSISQKSTTANISKAESQETCDISFRRVASVDLMSSTPLPITVCRTCQRNRILRDVHIRTRRDQSHPYVECFGYALRRDCCWTNLLGAASLRFCSERLVVLFFRSSALTIPTHWNVESMTEYTPDMEATHLHEHSNLHH